MYKLTIIVPKDKDGAGDNIKQFQHHEIFTYISSVFGGCTISDCIGYWTNSGKLFCENNYKIEIAVNDTVQHPETVRMNLLHIIHDIYLQDTYYTEINGVPELIKYCRTA